MFWFFTCATFAFYPELSHCIMYYALFSQLYSWSSHKSSSSWIFAVCINDRYNSSVAVISLVPQSSKYWQILNFIWKCICLWDFTLTIDAIHPKYRKLIIYFSDILKCIKRYKCNHTFFPNILFVQYLNINCLNLIKSLNETFS